MVSRDRRIYNFGSSFFFFFLITIRSGFLVEVSWSCVCQSLIGVCVCHSPGQLLGCAYTICSYGQISISCTSPSEYSFCANLLHSLILWLMVSSLSPHNLHLLFCCILSILALIWLVLIGSFCAAISLLKFPFFSHVQFILSEMLFINIHIYPTPPLGQDMKYDMTQGQFFKRFPSPRLVA